MADEKAAQLFKDPVDVTPGKAVTANRARAVSYSVDLLNRTLQVRGQIGSQSDPADPDTFVPLRDVAVLLDGDAYKGAVDELAVKAAAEAALRAAGRI